jgi:hypothetical protein
MLERYVWLVGWPPIINRTQLYGNRRLSTCFYWLYHHYRRRYRADVVSQLYEQSSLYWLPTSLPTVEVATSQPDSYLRFTTLQ